MCNFMDSQQEAQLKAFFGIEMAFLVTGHLPKWPRTLLGERRNRPATRLCSPAGRSSRPCLCGCWDVTWAMSLSVLFLLDSLPQGLSAQPSLGTSVVRALLRKAFIDTSGIFIAFLFLI